MGILVKIRTIPYIILTIFGMVGGTSLLFMKDAVKEAEQAAVADFLDNQPLDVLTNYKVVQNPENEVEL